MSVTSGAKRPCRPSRFAVEHQRLGFGDTEGAGRIERGGDVDALPAQVSLRQGGAGQTKQRGGAEHDA